MPTEIAENASFPQPQSSHCSLGALRTACFGWLVRVAFALQQMPHRGTASLAPPVDVSHLGLTGSMSWTERNKKSEPPLRWFWFLCGLYWTRTSDPIDVNDVLWATGQVVKLKCGREHTWKAFKIKAFSIFGGVQWKGVQGCSGGVHGPGV